MMILTFNHNICVRNEFLGSNFCRKVIPHMTLRVLINQIQAILGMSDPSIER